MLQDLHSPFRSFLYEMRQRYEEELRGGDFPGIILEKPDFSQLEERLAVFTPGRDRGFGRGVGSAPWLGAIYEAMGYEVRALALYRLGAYAWPHPWRLYPGDQDDFNARTNCQSRQLKAGICADRAGTKDRARELYTWAEANYTLTSKEVDWFLSSEQYQAIWEWHPYRAYTLACLERWEEALTVARETQDMVDQDERAQTGQSYRKEFRLLRVVLALASYKIDPSADNRHKAQEMLHPQAVASFDHAEHMDGLFYLFNLRARHPELANPPEAEMPQAERARQGTEACKQIMAGFGVRLDDRVESLQALDHRIRDLHRMAQSDEEKERQIFVWGCYFGEVVGAELAGGQWRISQDNLLDSTLTWAIGGDELHLEAFKIVHDYVTGHSDKSLHQSWLEAEDDYVEYAMAARYSD